MRKIYSTVSTTSKGATKISPPSSWLLFFEFVKSELANNKQEVMWQAQDCNPFSKIIEANWV